MDALSFIGTGDYKTTTYTFGGIEVGTNLFPNALIKIFKPEKLYLVQTEQARGKHRNNLWENECKIIDIMIPEGKSEEELWQILAKIGTSIPPNSELIIDVTHSFRSLPIITLAIAEYLRVTKNVQVKKIIYGAYEARDNDNVSPIFDITPFLHIIGWSTTIKQFVDFGNIGQIKELIKTFNYYHNNDKYNKELNKLGNKIELLSNALKMNRISESLEASQSLNQLIERIQDSINTIPQAKPLQAILELIPKRFQQLISTSEHIFTNDGFLAQTKVIRYYLETKQYVQAITLCRELLVSYQLKKLDAATKEDYLAGDKRKQAEEHLGKMVRERRSNKLSEEENALINLYDKIIQLRNDINHCGMRKKNDYPTETAIKNVIQYAEETINFIEKAIQGRENG